MRIPGTTLKNIEDFDWDAYSQPSTPTPLPMAPTFHGNNNYTPPQPVPSRSTRHAPSRAEIQAYRQQKEQAQAQFAASRQLQQMANMSNDMSFANDLLEPDMSIFGLDAPMNVPSPSLQQQQQQMNMYAPPSQNAQQTLQQMYAPSQSAQSPQQMYAPPQDMQNLQQPLQSPQQVYAPPQQSTQQSPQQMYAPSQDMQSYQKPLPSAQQMYAPPQQSVQSPQAHSQTFDSTATSMRSPAQMRQTPMMTVQSHNRMRGPLQTPPSALNGAVGQMMPAQMRQSAPQQGMRQPTTQPTFDGTSTLPAQMQRAQAPQQTFDGASMTLAQMRQVQMYQQALMADNHQRMGMQNGQISLQQQRQYQVQQMQLQRVMAAQATAGAPTPMNYQQQQRLRQMHHQRMQSARAAVPTTPAQNQRVARRTGAPTASPSPGPGNPYPTPNSMGTMSRTTSNQSLYSGGSNSWDFGMMSGATSSLGSVPPEYFNGMDFPFDDMPSPAQQVPPPPAQMRPRTPAGTPPPAAMTPSPGQMPPGYYYPNPSMPSPGQKNPLSRAQRRRATPSPAPMQQPTTPAAPAAKSGLKRSLDTTLQSPLAQPPVKKARPSKAEKKQCTTARPPKRGPETLEQSGPVRKRTKVSEDNDEQTLPARPSDQATGGSEMPAALEQAQQQRQTDGAKGFGDVLKAFEEAATSVAQLQPEPAPLTDEAIAQFLQADMTDKDIPPPPTPQDARTQRLEETARKYGQRVNYDDPLECEMLMQGMVPAGWTQKSAAVK